MQPTKVKRLFEVSLFVEKRRECKPELFWLAFKYTVCL